MAALNVFREDALSDESHDRAASAPATRDATSEEIETYRHVPDRLPRAVWLALAIGSLERLTFYSISTPWQNYMQRPRNAGDGLPGALGLGQAQATTIYNAYYLFAYFTPVVFGILSDAKMGRFLTLLISLSIYFLGCLIQFTTSLPAALDHGTGMGGLAVSMVLVGLGVGGTKATVSPFIADQYPHVPPQLSETKKGEKVIIDRSMTLQYIYNVFYWLTNLAGLSILVSSFLEKERGFWAAFLFAFCPSGIGIILLLVFRNSFVRNSANSTVLVKAGKALWCAARGRFRLDAARPVHQLEAKRRTVPWDDLFIEELKRGLMACRVMAWFVIFYLGMNQISNNLISQAGQMQLDGIPNDGVQILNAIACIILGPIIQKGLVPLLAYYRIAFRPISRMTLAFITMSAGYAYAAGVQKMIYNSGPCYDHPLICEAAQKVGHPPQPNNIQVWLQTPIYFLLAISEIFGFTSLSEYSYSKAPRDMRTIVQSLRQVTAGVGSAFGIALGQVSEDPKVLWLYVGLSVSLGLVSPLFWGLSYHLDRVDEELDALDLQQPVTETAINRESKVEKQHTGTDIKSASL